MIAINIESKNGTKIGLAALIPAKVTIKHAITKSTFVATFISNLGIIFSLSELIFAKQGKRTKLIKQVKVMVNNMNILLTGGTGLIGKALVEKLKSKNSITILTRTPNQHKASENIHYVTNLDDLDFTSFNIIVNLAGEPIVNKKWSEQQKDKLCQSRWQLTQKLVDKINSCSYSQPVRFISASAVGFYGRQDQRPINESFSSPYPEFSHMLCQRWEQIALEAENANTALLRTGIVLSNEGGALTKMLPAFKLGLGGRIASGSQMMPWIHIDDMVNGILFLINNDELQGPFHMTAPHPVSNKEFSQSLAECLHRPCLLPVPEFVLRLVMGEMADLLVYGQNVIPQRLLDLGFHFEYPKLKPALENLL